MIVEKKKKKYIYLKRFGTLTVAGNPTHCSEGLEFLLRPVAQHHR